MHASAKLAAPARKKAVRVRPVPAVSRAVAILRLLGSTPEPLGVKAIAQSLGMVTSTCLHILRVLVDEGLVRVDPATKRYALDIGLVVLAASAMQGTSFASLVQPCLDRLAGKWGVTAIGVELDGSEHMVVVALARSPLPFSLHVDVGSRFPALISATGRLVAAFGDWQADELEKRFSRMRWQRAPSLAQWKKEVAAARELGFSIDRNNYILGVTLVAAPVLDTAGRLRYTLVAAGLAEALDEKASVQLARDMKAEAGRLSLLLQAAGARR